MKPKTKYNKINYPEKQWKKRKPETVLWVILLILGGYVMSLVVQGFLNL